MNADYSFKIVIGILLSFVFCVSGCARSKKTEQPIKSCPANFLKGTGVGETEQDALAQARAEISSQIQLSITVADKYTKKQHLTENKEVLEEKFKSQIKQTTELLNAQDAKLHSSEKTKDGISVVACMSRDDAAKPYLAELPRINDSLNLALQTVLAQDHPLIKKESAHLAENLRLRQMFTVQILNGLGKNTELQSNALYEKMSKDYEVFSSKFKLIWEGSSEPVSQMLLSKISSRYKIETGSCDIGLKLVPATDISCESSQYGPQCSYLPTMEGRSCTNELYFTLKGQMVRGTGERDRNDAMRKLLAMIPNAPFWRIWFDELDRYK